ncbi:MAG: GHKL domain-containing protein [Oscillospiraceae bacterium]|nr:GHKL domain-containing protein [Oscillospiraceae bacterium]
MQINPYFIYPLLEAPVLFIAFSNISKIKFGWKKTLLAIVFIYTSIVLLSVYIFPESYLTGIVGSIAYISIISLIANSIAKNLPLCIFYAVLSNIVFLLAGNVTGAILAAVFESYNPGDWIWWFIFVAFAIPLTFFVSYIFGIFLKKRIIDLEDSIRKKLAIYMLALASMTLIYFQLHSYVRGILEPEVMGLVYASSLALHFIILAYIVITFAEKFQKDVEINHHKEMLDNLQSYTVNIEELTLEVRKFIHDHKNLMLGFFEYIENEDMEGIRKFYNDYMHCFTDNTTSKNTSIDNFTHIKTPEIKSLLLFKVLYAQRKGIKVILEINETIDFSHNDLVNICRIMGILLDNAIEACLNTKEPVLNILLTQNDYGNIFAVSNTCREPPMVSVIFKKGYTTKPNGNGLGLYTASMLVNENDKLFLSTHINDKWFTQKLIISKE